MTDPIVIVLAALACGFLSAMGIGGGSLLIIVMTQVFFMQQQQAQLINLIYFVPTALIATLIHRKNGYIKKKTALLTALFGSAGAIAGSYLAMTFSPGLLKKGFGVFLLVLGAHELFVKKSQRRESK